MDSKLETINLGIITKRNTPHYTTTLQLRIWLRTHPAPAVSILHHVGTPERGKGRGQPGGGGKGQAFPSNQHKIILPFAQFKLVFNIVTVVKTVLLTNSSPVYCILYFHKSLK